MTGTDLEFHPAANLFPLLDGSDFDDLVNNIREYGQIEPIKLYDGKILDGRNRYRACQAAGVKPKTTTWKGDNPYGYVLSANLTRRHLTSDQRAAIVMSVYPEIQREARARMIAGVDPGPKSDQGPDGDKPKRAPRASEQAAEQAGVSRYKIEQAEVVAEDPEILKEVIAGETTLRAAEKKVKARKGGPTSEMPPGMRVQQPRPRREDPTLADRLYKLAQRYPDASDARSVGEEIQTANLDLPRDAVKTLRKHLKDSKSGLTALDEGLKALEQNRMNDTP